ncbi:hypothetical protein CASFOL_003401 [Castilleja foliolosa]|uniref:Uncharacterized protein n=1 Tax=Castilleja foliolosa TaxID=1961234 RepID=A0ABD3EHE6_9LAMI
MPQKPPPQPPAAPPLAPHHRHHHHLLKKPTSLPDAIFTALSLLVLFSTSPKSPPLFSLPTNIKLSFPLYSRKFPKMSSSFTNPRKPGRRTPSPPFATPQSLSDWLKPRLGAETFGSWGVKPGTKNVHNLWLEVVDGETVLTDSLPPVRTVENRLRPLSEKMKPGESVEAAVFRAVKEELGSLVKIGTLDSFDGDGIVRILPGSYVKKVEGRVSASYPGLPACYVLHTVDAEVAGLPEDEFCTEEMDEYEVSSERDVADCAVSCKKHYWKWVDCDSV